jgi:replicative DNA helicase
MGRHEKPAAFVPPNSAQAEAGVIGGLLLDNAAWPNVQGLLAFEDFYQRRHQILFHVIGDLLNAGDPADVVTVSDRLEANGHAETVGGLGYLVGLAKDTPSAANIETYARIVRDKASLRAMLALSAKMRNMALDPAAEAREILAAMEREIFELAQRDLRGKKGLRPLKSIMADLVDRMETNYDAPPSGVLGISTGLAELDRLTGGYQSGQLIIQAGRPGMGKSVLALHSAEACAISGRPVAFFSLEMEDLSFGERMLAGAASVNLRHIRDSWRLVDADWTRISAGLQRVSGLPIYIDETPALSLADVRARALKLNAQVSPLYAGGLGMVVIDYLQLMSAEADGTRATQIEEITRGLKRLAKELGIPVIALSQLNRSLEGRPNKRPVMSDLRDSGGIEQDADIVIFVYRDEVYNADSQDQGVAELIIGKQRSGPLGTARVAFEGQYVRFRDLEAGRHYAAAEY